MTIDGVVLHEWGVTFAVVIVKPSAMRSNAVADETRERLQACFPDMPIVLASQDSLGVFTFHGRRDLADNLATIDPAAIPWQQYTF